MPNLAKHNITTKKKQRKTTSSKKRWFNKNRIPQRITASIQFSDQRILNLNNLLKDIRYYLDI